MSIKNKKIAFILFDYPLGVSLMVINTIALLMRNNEVAVFINSWQKGIPCDAWLNKLIVALPPGSVFLNKIEVLLLNFWNIAISFFLSLLNRPKNSWEERKPALQKFIKPLRQKLSEKRYDIIVPVESMSLIAVDTAGAGSADIIYFDMELLDWASGSPGYENKLELKEKQYKALQKVKHVMITSHERAGIFSRINHFDPERISVLPVMPLRKPHGQRSSYFRDKFSIPQDRLIVIYCGNFMPWAQCLEIINSMDSWPSNAILVMHTWNKPALRSKYFKDMRAAARTRPVFFSTDFLLYDDLTVALTSADIGLLFYEATDANFTEICFSSNKMGDYIAAGLPIIASPSPSLNEFIEKHGIGKAVVFDDIGNAIREIFEKKDFYQKNVQNCRETVFSFDNYFAKAFECYEAHAGAAR